MIVEDWIHCPIDLGLQSSCYGCPYIVDCFDSDYENENENENENED